MMDLLTTEGGRLFLLLMAGVGILLQWDALAESIREARKGGDSPSEEEPPPPDGD